jgi:hypothetical protein
MKAWEVTQLTNLLTHSLTHSLSNQPTNQPTIQLTNWTSNTPTNQLTPWSRVLLGTLRVHLKFQNKKLTQENITNRPKMRYLPETAVRNTMPLQEWVSHLNFRTEEVTVSASFCAGRRWSRADQRRSVYRTKAKLKCAASRYCDTRGTSLSPWKRSSNPDCTMYQPIKPCAERGAICIECMRHSEHSCRRSKTSGTMLHSRAVCYWYFGGASYPHL